MRKLIAFLVALVFSAIPTPQSTVTGPGIVGGSGLISSVPPPPGGATNFQVNATNVTNQATINFINSSTPLNGVSVTFSNPSQGNVQATLTGTPLFAGGSNTQMQYNCSGANCGTIGFTWNNVSNVPSLALGSIATDVNPFLISWTTNNASQIFNGMKFAVTNTAQAAGSLNYQWCGGSLTNLCMTLDPLGNLLVPGTITSAGFAIPGANNQLLFNNTGSSSGVAGVVGTVWNPVNQTMFWKLGNLTSDINPFGISWSTNNSSVLFNGMKFSVVNSGQASGSLDYQWCGGPTSASWCITVDTLGNMVVPGSFTTKGSGSWAFGQTTLPSTPANNFVFSAPTSIPVAYRWIVPSAAGNGLINATQSTGSDGNPTTTLNYIHVSTGTVTVSASTSGSASFGANAGFTVAPDCQLTPISDPTAVGGYWVISTTSTVTANVHTSGTIIFNYDCKGAVN